MIVTRNGPFVARFLLPIGDFHLEQPRGTNDICVCRKTLAVVLNYWNFSLSIAIFAVLLLAQVSIVRRIVLVTCE